MTSNRLYCNKSILLQNFRQHGWIGIVYLFALLFVVPFYMLGRSMGGTTRTIETLFEVSGVGQGFMILIFPVLAGIFILRYIQSNAQSILYHSLPLRRKHILSTNLIAGFIILLVPVWITAGMLAIISSVSELAYVFSGYVIVQWGLAVSIFTLFIFVFTIFVGMCIGQSILQGLVTYAFLIFPALMNFLLRDHLSTFLKGYYDVLGDRNDVAMSPFIYLLSLGDSAPKLSTVIIYAGLTILFIALSFGLYQLRQVENATQAVAFGFLKPLFRIVMTLGAALLMGEYFSAQVFSSSAIWIVIGYIIGGFIGYLLSEMVLQKTWLLPFKTMSKGILVYGTITAVILYVPVASWNGYEKNIPEIDQIQSVGIGNPYSFYNSEDQYNQYIYSNEASYIRTVQALHQKLVDSDLTKPSHKYSNSRAYQVISINYKLIHGGGLERTYYVPVSDFENELAEIYNTNSYKYNENRLYLVEENINKITLRSELLPDRMIVISDPQEVTEFKELLKAEILQKKAVIDSDSDTLSPIASIEMNKTKEGVIWTGEIEPSFESIRAWLKQKGLTERIEITPEQIETADVVREIIGTPDSGMYTGKEDVQARIEANTKYITDDKQIIADILNHNSQSFRSFGETVYYVELRMKNEQIVYTMVREKDASAALIGLFK